MNLKETKISSKPIYKGKIFTLTQDKVLLPNGNVATRDYLEHPGGVCIAARKDDGTFLMVEQFRYTHNQLMLEFPAGRKDENEEPMIGAIRELKEETGFTVKNVVSLGEMIPNVAYLQEKIYMYYGEVDIYVGQSLDNDEFVEVKTFSMNQIIKMIDNNEIQDSKTIIMAYKIKLLLNL